MYKSNMDIEQIEQLADAVYNRRYEHIDLIYLSTNSDVLLKHAVKFAVDEVLKNPPKSFHQQTEGRFAGMGKETTKLHKQLLSDITDYYLQKHYQIKTKPHQ